MNIHSYIYTYTFIHSYIHGWIHTNTNSNTYNTYNILYIAGFSLPIVRQPRKDVFTCFAGGYIASGSQDGQSATEKIPKPYLPRG